MSRPVTLHLVVFTVCDDTLQVLLLPADGTTWQLPGEELRPDESLEGAANRLLAALVKRREAYLEQLYTYGAARRASVSVVYFVLIPAQARQVPEATARWLPAAGLPALAGDHGEILAYALRRLRYKLEYSAVGFQLLPDVFTLSELQHTYEIVLGERLDKRNFRRRILRSGIIEPTAQRRLGEGRPARLYRYRPDAVAEVRARRLFP